MSDFERFIDENWPMFVAFTGRFHPVPETLLARYPYEWEWQCLSHNPSLAWSAELIARFADRWDWWALSRNPAIRWDAALLDRFADRVDWQALGYNTALPLSAAFLARYEDRLELLSGDIEALTPALRARTSLYIADAPDPDDDAQDEPITFANIEDAARRAHAVRPHPAALALREPHPAVHRRRVVG